MNCSIAHEQDRALLAAVPCKLSSASDLSAPPISVELPCIKGVPASRTELANLLQHSI